MSTENKQAVVFVHGYLSSPYTWQKTLNLMRNSLWKPFAIDLSGKDSLEIQAEALIQFLNRQKLESCIVAGNSMGGAVAMLAAAQYPKRITQLVLAASVTPWTVLTPFLKTLRMPLLGECLLALTHPKFVCAHLKEIYGNPDGVTPDVVEGWYRPLTRPETRRGALNLIRGIRPGAYLELPEKISQPVLVISGDKDPLTPWPEGEKLAKAIPRSQFELFKDVGHLPQEEVPEKFVESLRRFLES